MLHPPESLNSTVGKLTLEFQEVQRDSYTQALMCHLASFTKATQSYLKITNLCIIQDLEVLHRFRKQASSLNAFI